MSISGIHGLLVRIPGGGRAPRALRLALGGTGGVALTPLFDVRAGAVPGAGARGAVRARWYAAPMAGVGLRGGDGWDAAHGTLESLAAAGADVVEPDFVQDWLGKDSADAEARGLGAGSGFRGQKRDLPPEFEKFAWHLEDRYSELRSARSAARGAAPEELVRIAHLDTGVDPEHSTYPHDRIEAELGRNFSGEGAETDYRDHGREGLLKQPGHGAGTLGILSGGLFRHPADGSLFNDELGGAPDARIVPVRVGNSVVQIKTSAVARGIGYAAELCDDERTRVHVLSMSMGGVASEAWADAVNNAYEAGVVLVTAAGNNFSLGWLGGAPTRHIVYPARFGRVIAACGVMADGRPYYGLSLGTMQGNWGPERKMSTAMAAYTPNMPWARWGSPDVVDMDGAGTSSATPQIAAAAALYIQKNAARLAAYPEKWMRVEAVRRGLFDSAASAGVKVSEKLGRGVLRARQALAIPPAGAASLTATPKDSAGFSFLKVLTGLGVNSPPSERMLVLEATQLPQRWSKRERVNPYEEVMPDPDAADAAAVRRYLELVESDPAASRTLRRWAGERLAGMNGGSGSPTPSGSGGGGKPPGKPARTAAARPVEPFVPPRPPVRRLRGYALDPSLATSLDTAVVGETTLEIPWEALRPGPKGEYIEVIDDDPASGCVYEPVNLDRPELLAQDGLAPSEGTPQFHQQMVYAVASLTIRNFERALGRRALWHHRPHPPGKSRFDDSVHVEQLRIYPHALREANAYYSPGKVALLFGYFGASRDNPGNHVPGSRVFTCLSHDIIAHETTHALLDGMHAQYLVSSNPDVLAFHEAFADIVALFQHFTLPELLRHQIASTRGDIRSQRSLLGSLASQFGHATGARQALREAIGSMKDGQWIPHKARPEEYQQTIEPHDRGAILVAAVFDAFLSIYERRVTDLLRLATEGTGVLRPGAIPPDLVNRLADEARKSAQHVLTMCVRALDYCPPTDITFGEYLRAIITADHHLVASDDLNYRVAFVEAFRRRGIYPRDLRTLGVESLLWRSPQSESQPPSAALSAVLKELRGFPERFLHAQTRREVFDLQREMRRKLRPRLRKHIDSGPVGRSDAEFLGLDPSLPSLEVRTARIALRTRPDGTVKPQVLIGILQRRTKVPIDPSGRLTSEGMVFEGGCTIVADLRTLEIEYCIRKRTASASRLSRQQEFALERVGSLRGTYLGAKSMPGWNDEDDGHEPFAALHGCRHD